MELNGFPWPVTFYVFGGASVIWFIIFSFLCTSSPMTHPCIKPKEMTYLMQSIGQTTKDKPPIPWKSMLLSMAMLGVIISQLGHDWGYFVMVTFLPKYMSDVLGVSTKSNGLYTSLPYLAMWLASLASGPLADWLIRTGKLSITTERKLFTFLSALLPGLFLVIASYAGCNKTAVVTLFTISMLFMGPYYAGQKLTPMDMSPSYAGTIMALTNGGGAIAGLASSPIVGALTPNAALREWHVVFITCLVILVISALIFWWLGSGEVQPYDPLYKAPGDNEEEKKK
ncbi:putative inorganic phosphate cotransporter isoform X2 [Drosophila tropicalis]|uniref:putative inorganic phosphate cotransporter isoform X2 n=1 Tax=Drosophila tropicalis TaxID=46794 RepID=UPI0035ABD210